MSGTVNVTKKKSIIGRLFNFASHSVNFNKKSNTTNHKKKIKNSTTRLVVNPSMILYTEPIDTITFCDYCDQEILAKYIGQNIIYHEACKPRGIEAMEMIDIVPPSKYGSVVKETSHHLTESMRSQRSDRDASHGNNGGYGDDDDEQDRFYTARCSSSQTELRWLPGDDRPQLLPGATLTSSGPVLSDSYTLSTVDMCTVRHVVGGGAPGLHTQQQSTVSVRVYEHIDDESATTAGAPPRQVLVTRPANDEFDQQTLPLELGGLIDVFNDNDQGLLIERVQGESGPLMGKVRVFVNLMRPIKMLLTARPPSIFDVFPPDSSDGDKPTMERAYYNREAIFWLPRGTTNLLYMDLNCTTTELITMLLTKYNIQNNPKKFALYEHTIITPHEVEARKFRPHHCPLRVMLQWCLHGPAYYRHQMKRKRFVLQENDPGSIDWDEFSIPELNSFLKIITQEELEKRNQIMRHFGVLRAEITRCMRENT